MFPFFNAFFFLFFFACVSFHFSIFKRFLTFGQVKGNVRYGRSRHPPTNQSFRVCKVNLATLEVAKKDHHVLHQPFLSSRSVSRRLLHVPDREVARRRSTAQTHTSTRTTTLWRAYCRNKPPSGFPFARNKIRTISFFFSKLFSRFGFDFRRRGFFFERFEFSVCSKFNHTQCGRICACAVACLYSHNSISNVVAYVTIHDDIFLCINL